MLGLNSFKSWWKLKNTYNNLYLIYWSILLYYFFQSFIYLIFYLFFIFQKSFPMKIHLLIYFSVCLFICLFVYFRIYPNVPTSVHAEVTWLHYSIKIDWMTSWTKVLARARCWNSSFFTVHALAMQKKLLDIRQFLIRHFVW